MTLNDLMEFDHIVYSDGNGNVYDRAEHPLGMWAPQPYVDLDADGQMVSLDPADIHDLGAWRLLNGFSGQDRYGGPIMHESEFIGGGLERHIRENAGYYVVVEVTGIAGPAVVEHTTDHRGMVTSRCPRCQIQYIHWDEDDLDEDGNLRCNCEAEPECVGWAVAYRPIEEEEEP